MYTLYSFGTPNGFKPTIMLEELKLLSERPAMQTTLKIYGR